MGAVFGVAWSLVLTAGGATVAAAAPDGGTAAGGQYLAGHVLLGVGLGHLAAILLQAAARLAVRRFRATGAPDTAAASATVRPSATIPHSVPAAPVAVLPVRPTAPMTRLRGRHAA